MDKNDAAFPLAIDGKGRFEDAWNEGMSLRDYFAAKALAALISHEGKDGNTRGSKGVPVLAGYAYEYADALLKARAS